LGAYKYLLFSNNFYGKRHSIANGTKIPHFQFPTHLLMILYIVVKIQVTYNNKDATWQEKNPLIQGGKYAYQKHDIKTFSHTTISKHFNFRSIISLITSLRNLRKN